MPALSPPPHPRLLVAGVVTLAAALCAPASHGAPLQRSPQQAALSPAGSSPAASSVASSSVAEANALPRVRIVGTVQDGGLPHAACTCERCEAAREDPSRRRYVASIALLLPAEEGRTRVYLVDATPDIREQLVLLRDVRDPPVGRVDRAPLDGILLTHAHIGHYLGLAFFGFEAVHTRRLPVLATPAMCDFLRSNAPFRQLVTLGNVELRPLADGEVRRLAGGVTVQPLRVPHRDEFTDTVGFLVRGPAGASGSAGGATPPHRVTLLYVPDTDAWRAWDSSLREVIAEESVQIALLDGTFFSPAELPGRDVSSIGHPLMRQTMDLLEPLVQTGRLRVLFTHLNHSNPALAPDSPAAREVRARGFAIAHEGEELSLALR